MEALLEKEGTVENWNDERLDGLARRMDGGFKEMREGFSRIEHEMKEGFAEVNNRIFKLMILLLLFCGGLVTTLLAVVLERGGS
jgi:hypothetical protein